MKNNPENEHEKVHMKSLVSCLTYLQKGGFETQFKAIPEGLLSLKTDKTFRPSQITILHFYRFEGESDPSDSSILYAIEASDGEKGTLVDGYGTESDGLVTTFMHEVNEISK